MQTLAFVPAECLRVGDQVISALGTEGFIKTIFDNRRPGNGDLWYCKSDDAQTAEYPVDPEALTLVIRWANGKQSVQPHLWLTSVLYKG